MKNLPQALATAVLLGSLLAALSGCDDAGDPPALTGVVRGDLGAPLGGAGVLVDYEFPELSLPGHALADPVAACLRPATPIDDLPPTPGWLRSWITKPGSMDPVRVLYAGVYGGGPIVLRWDGLDDAGLVALPGVYEWRLVTSWGSVGSSDFYWYVNVGELPGLTTLAGRRWHAITRADGTFSVPLGELDCGYGLHGRGGYGNPSVPTVGWRVRIWAVVPGHGLTSRSVDIDPQAGADVELDFPVKD